MLGSAKSEHPELTNSEIILHEFQHVVTIPERHGLTDDFAVAIPRSACHRAVKVNH